MGYKRLLVAGYQWVAKRLGHDLATKQQQNKEHHPSMAKIFGVISIDIYLLNITSQSKKSIRQSEPNKKNTLHYNNHSL